MAVDNLRTRITANIKEVLQGMTDPRPVLVTSEPFEASELAITQFPAVLIIPTREDRETITMGSTGAGRRMGTLTYTLRGFVRGNSKGDNIDKKRNDLIEAIEEALDSNRYRELLATGTSDGVTDSQIRVIEIVDRLPPLAEFSIEYQVTYNYKRGTV